MKTAAASVAASVWPESRDSRFESSDNSLSLSLRIRVRHRQNRLCARLSSIAFRPANFVFFPYYAFCFLLFSLLPCKWKTERENAAPAGPRFTADSLAEVRFTRRGARDSRPRRNDDECGGGGGRTGRPQPHHAFIQFPHLFDFLPTLFFLPSFFLFCSFLRFAVRFREGQPQTVRRALRVATPSLFLLCSANRWDIATATMLERAFKKLSFYSTSTSTYTVVLVHTSMFILLTYDEHVGGRIYNYGAISIVSRWILVFAGLISTSRRLGFIFSYEWLVEGVRGAA